MFIFLQTGPANNGYIGPKHASDMRLRHLVSSALAFAPGVTFLN